MKSSNIGGQAVLEGIMMKPMYELPSEEDVEKVIVTPEFVKGEAELTVIRKAAEIAEKTEQ